MPAPAPAAIGIIRSPACIRTIWPRSSLGRPRLDDLPFASTAAPVPMAMARPATSRSRQPGSHLPGHRFVHHFRNAVTACLGSEPCDKECHCDRADHRDKDDRSSRRTWRCERLHLAYLDLPEKRDIVDQTDQVTKSDRAEAG